MNWTELIHIAFNPQYSLEVRIGPILWIILSIAIIWHLIKVLLHLTQDRNAWSPVEINLSLPGLSSVTIKPDHEVARIAHQAWTELITRKVGLLFEPEHDVIVEVYDSWYKLFSEIRLLVRSIPAERLKASDDAKKLANVLITVLNEGLRPHLTKWQARFRRWYSNELQKDERKNMFPQDIQKLFPQYKELETDLIKVNKIMIEFAKELQKISQGEDK